MPIIAHNKLSQFTERQLNITDKNKSKSSEKLSSGYRVNRAADDAAGLAISEKLRWQVRGLKRASLNISDGISLCQVADGALHEGHTILQRMRELSVQAASDTNTDEDRQAIQWEIEALVDEVDRIANDTKFNKDIFPLKGDVSSSGSGRSGSASSVAPLLDSDYPGSNVQIVDSSTVSNYTSYVDSDGKTHYQLGSGTFQIIGLSDAVFEVAGNSCIENTSLTNVTIECAAGTNLSVKNVTVDNSANVYGTWSKVKGTGIGAALKFNGNGNSLNCYGNNEFNGGMDNYIVYTDGSTIDYWSGQRIDTYNIACAGINVGSGTELSVNGTQNSNLKVHGCFSYEFVTHQYNAYTASSFGIGSNYHEDGGNIVINSGNLSVYSGIKEGSSDSYWCIGGGYGATITINGGSIDAVGGMEACIGGGRTFGIQERGEYADCKLEVTINGGIINAQGHNAIGGAGKGSAITGGAEPQIINITGGDITAIGSYVGIGNESPYESAGIINISGGNIHASALNGAGAAIGTGNDGYGGKINITGGNITAVAKKPSDAIGTGENSVSVKVNIDGSLTDASGSDDGNGNNVYTYTGATGGGTGGSQGTNHNVTEKIWIQMGAKSGQGMFLSLVDATAKGIGLTDPPLDVTSFENASDAITRLETAIDKVSTCRSTFGAQQNRLEHGKNLDDLTAENSQAAESRIRDTDMAAEMVNHSRHSILQQAGQSMLSQANQLPNGVLRLLQ